MTSNPMLCEIPNYMKSSKSFHIIRYFKYLVIPQIVQFHVVFQTPCNETCHFKYEIQCCIFDRVITYTELQGEK